jgi:hypothetical protein
MKTKLLALLVLAGSSLFAGPRVFVGVGFGAPAYGYYAPPPPVVTYAAPAYPAPGYGYSWVNGYYNWYGGRYAWRPGYWARPPYAGAYWSAPRYYNHRYYGGYWRHR